MTEPNLVLTRLAGDESAAHLLVLGPSLGTGVAGLWSDCAKLLPPDWQVVGWDLPGHGASPPATHAFTVDELAAAVRTRSAELAAGRRAAYAGVSLGGAVGFTLALEPGPFDAIVTLASAPRIGTPEGWRERAAYVRRAGTAAMVEGSATRWFAPGFFARDPVTGCGLLLALQHVDDASYALACEALATYDVRDRLTSAKVPPLVAGGAHDTVVTPDQVDVVLDGVAHLPPAEDPAATARLLTTHLSGEQR